MGGKSRKSGGISKTLINKIVSTHKKKGEKWLQDKTNKGK